MAVTVGSKAPAFTLPASGGKEISLADYAGKKVILYFYPKDSTPGCTREACAFRDALGRFTRRQAVVLGVSPDSVRSHDRFRDKHGLPFPLLSDEGHEVARAYGVWVKKSQYGREYMGVERSTFVIGADGRIKAVFRKVKVDGHADEVLEAVSGRASQGRRRPGRTLRTRRPGG